jgi:hypothetical protein
MLALQIFDFSEDMRGFGHCILPKCFRVVGCLVKWIKNPEFWVPPKFGMTHINLPVFIPVPVQGPIPPASAKGQKATIRA